MKHPIALSFLFLWMMPLSADVVFNNQSRSAFSDPKAEKITLKEHDLIHVVVSLLSTSSHEINADGSRQTDTEATLDKWVRLSRKRKQGKKEWILEPSATNIPEVSFEADSQYAADGKASTEHAIQEKITAEVIRVYPNGDAEIRGQDFFDDNGNRRTFTLSGRVSLKDIGPDYTVAADKLFNRVIDIKSEGQVAEDGTRNWFQKFFTWIWPF